MTAIEYLNIDIDILTPAELAGAAEAALLDLIPCEFCSAWVPRAHDIDYYLADGIEVCEECLRQIDAGRHPLQMSGKGETDVVDAN
jgi:hypothetical protein